MCKPPFSSFFFPLRFHSTSSPDACYHRDGWQCPETIFLFFLSCLLKPWLRGPSCPLRRPWIFTWLWATITQQTSSMCLFRLQYLSRPLEVGKDMCSWGKPWWRKRKLDIRNTELCLNLILLLPSGETLGRLTYPLSLGFCICNEEIKMLACRLIRGKVKMNDKTKHPVQYLTHSRCSVNDAFILLIP